MNASPGRLMPSPSDPLVSVVIVTWNGRQYLDACLHAVASQNGVSTETILVDNASNDGTVAHVQERFPHVRIIALPENRGFAGGNNAGVREARGRFIALLNNDAVPEPDWIEALLAGLNEDAGFALVTSRIVYMHDPGLIDSAGDGMLAAGGAFKRHHGASVELARESAEVFGVCGAACLMPRRVFDELGGFDEDFFVSHEDVDLSYRARLLGYRCRYVANAVVHHHGSMTISRVSGFAIFQGQRNLEWLYFQNTPTTLLLTTLPSHMLYVAAAGVHFARGGALGTFMRAKLAAVAGLPRALRKRWRVQRARRVDAAALRSLMETQWLSTKLREKRFDAGLAGGRR
jgi:GT2 family glycosyltransferase